MSDTTIRPGSQRAGSDPASSDHSMRPSNKTVSVTASVPATPHAVHSSRSIGRFARSRSKSPLPTYVPGDYTPPTLLSPEYCAHHTGEKLISKDCKPLDLLKALANHTFVVSSSSILKGRHEQKTRDLLRSQLVRMTPSQRDIVIERLRSPEMEGLHYLAREGVDKGKLSNGDHVDKVLHGVADNLDYIRSELGIDDGPREPTKRNASEAGKVLAIFASGIDRHMSEIEVSLDQEVLDRYNESDKNLTREQKAVGKITPSVCQGYEKDVLRSYHVLEKEDGSRSWVLSPRERANAGNWDSDCRNEAVALAAERLDEFTNANTEQTMAVSRLMNQSSLFYCQVVNLTMKEEMELVVDDMKLSDMKCTDRPTFLCKDNGDGSLTVKASTSGMVEYIQGSDVVDESHAKEFVNPENSFFEGSTTYLINQKGEASLTDVSFNLQVSRYEGFDPNDHGIEKQVNPRDRDRSDVMTIMEEEYSIPAEIDIMRMGLAGGNPELADSLISGGLEAFSGRVAELSADSGLPDGQKEILQALQENVNFLISAKMELGELGDLAKDGAIPDRVTVREMIDDLREMLSAGQRGNWAAMETGGVHENVVSAHAAYAHFCEVLIRDSEAFLAEADEQNYGLAAGIEADVTAALHSRANHCAMQARAVNKLMHNFYNEVADIGRQNSNPGLQGEDEVAKLLAESTNRMARIGAALEDYHNGDGPLPEFGRGVSDAEYQSLKKGIIKSLRNGGELPLSHPRLSEAQLMQARIEHFLDQNPGYSEVMRPHMERYTAMLAREIAAGDWSEVRGSFNDVGGDGRRRQLTNILTPGPSIADPAIKSTYDGLGVSHHDHEQTSHAANLAHSQLNNSRGQRLFSGLRHASLASKMSRSDFLAASRERKEIFVRELLDDPRFCTLVEQNNCRTMDEMVGLLGSPEHSGETHSWLREDGTRNAAVDLVSSAVATNPYLRDEALRNGVVFLTLDSVSMLAPSDSEAGRRNGAFQSEQEAALAGLGEGPVRIALTGPDGVRREVDVVISPRQFNFSVKPRSRLERFLRRVFGGATDWRAMDAKNSASLTDMLGDLSSGELGGEAGRVLRYLRTGSDEVLSPAQKAFLDDPDSPYHENRADLIEELAGQVKELYNSGSHRNPSSDPHKLVSRIAMLSHMLGHSPAYNCGNGLSRTGGMDVDTKLLAASMAADGRVPSPDTPPDQLRRMHFELNTGQLAMNEKSTGVRRFYERLRAGRMAPGRNDGAARTALRNHFNSPLVRSLYSNK